MGLIKAAVGAVGSTLHDQWKDYIRCEDLGNDILMKKVSTPNGVISKDSAIQVAPGQMAIIFDSGKIVDATAEEGIYIADVDMDAVREYRANEVHGNAYRRPWKYSIITEENINNFVPEEVLKEYEVDSASAGNIISELKFIDKIFQLTLFYNKKDKRY